MADRLWSYLLQGGYGNSLLRSPLLQQINELKDSKTVTAYQSDVSEELIGSLGLIEDDSQDTQTNLRCRTTVGWGTYVSAMLPTANFKGVNWPEVVETEVLPIWRSDFVAMKGDKEKAGKRKR
eukprot:1305408-Amphidinium_carterae.1